MNDFFNKLYYRIYFKASLNDNEKGKLLTIGLISFFQTCNLLTLLNVFFKITSLNSYYNIKTCFIFLFFTAIVFNVYYFEIKKNGRKIMESRKYDPKDNIIWQYAIFSFLGIFFSLLIYTEF